MALELSAGTRGMYRPARVAPLEGKPRLPAYLRRIISNSVAAIPAAAYTEPVVRIARPGGDILYICDPALLEVLLLAEHETFPKSPPVQKMLKPALGEGLITAEGAQWRWQRRLAAPVFRQKSLQPLVPHMVAPFDALARQWADGGEVRIDAYQDMTEATFEVLRDAIFSGDRALEASAIFQAVERYRTGLAWAMVYEILGVPDWVPRPRRGRMRAAARLARATAADYVASGAGGDDALVSGLASHQDPETGRPMDREGLVDNLLTLIVAGHETSSAGMIWTLHLLAEQPGHQDELIAEVDAVTGGATIGAADLPKLEKTERFIKESMRLFPPVSRLGRVALEPMDIKGVAVAQGTVIAVPIYAIHRRADLWDHPDLFDPMRFTREAEKARPRMAYLPFGAGPRICIGATLSMMEMVAGVATMLQKVRFEPEKGFVPEPVNFVTLRPRTGMKLRAVAR